MKLNKYIGFVLAAMMLIVISCGKKVVPSAAGRGREYDSVRFDYYFIEGIKLKVLGNTGEAVKFFEQCLKINPGSGAAFYQIAQILLAGGNAAGAKSYLKEAVKLEPANKWYLLMLAGIYYQEADLDSTIIYYEKAASAYPGEEDMMFTLANLYSEERNYDKANRIYEELDSKYGVNQRSTVEAIKNLLLAEKYEEAETKAKALLEEYPDEILYNGLLAEIYRGKGEMSKAMEVYNRLLENNPDNPETQLSLCDFLISEKKYDELFLLLNKVILNDLITREDKLSLCATLIETDDIVINRNNELMLSMMVLEAKYRDDHIVQLLRPELLYQEKKYKEAADRLEEIIKLKPENYFAWEKLLLVYLDAGDAKKLEERGKECATRYNRSFIAKVLYATGASMNSNYDTALEELRKADILAGNDNNMKLQVLSVKADVLYKMKKYEESFNTFDEALKISNNDITVLNNYAYYLAERNLRLKEAEEMAEKVISTENDNYTFMDTYGWVLYKRGKIKEAERIFREIIEKSPEKDAEYFEHYGYVLKKKKDCEEAGMQWNEALKLDSTKIWLYKEIQDCATK